MWYTTCLVWGCILRQQSRDKFTLQLKTPGVLISRNYFVVPQRLLQRQVNSQGQDSCGIVLRCFFIIFIIFQRPMSHRDAAQHSWKHLSIWVLFLTNDENEILKPDVLDLASIHIVHVHNSVSNQVQGQTVSVSATTETQQTSTGPWAVDKKRNVLRWGSMWPESRLLWLGKAHVDFTQSSKEVKTLCIDSYPTGQCWIYTIK